VKGEEDIKQSLGILLSTTLGERVMLAEFGCDLTSQVFEPNEPAFRTLITGIVGNAIKFFETRITLDDIGISFDAEGGLVRLTINYTINSTNSRSNIVYPYYINEGTNVNL
jgi:phage baseplate assembly protein W